MKNIIFQQPARVVFGQGTFDQFIQDIKGSNLKRLFILVVPFLKKQIDQKLKQLVDCGITYNISSELNSEPGISHFHQFMNELQFFQPDAVIGIGGGSIMDMAKLLSVMTGNDQILEEVVGVGFLKKRKLYLACLPTTAGTGSEVSPNAILMDEADNTKKGFISPYLVPDAAYIDPLLTIGLPAEIIASTGMDAITHCLEAYTNKFAHPMVDLYALEGIRLISRNLLKACQDGSDIPARTSLSLGSLYGGMCLGPVNTTAVHALSYPLGSMFKVPHGLANALLLPYVMEYNLSANAEQFQQVALALGAEQSETPEETALKGVVLVRKLMQQCKLPSKLSEIGIPENAIPEMAMSALKIQRLLKNNLREILVEDAINIYQKAY